MKRTKRSLMGDLAMRARIAAGCAALCLFGMPSAAQDLDVAALIADIDERSGQYRQLTEILQGADATRALAAFDVMLETGDPTMRETAIAAAMTATDERLRARALWETLALKDSLTLRIDTEDMDDDARAALDGWIGAVSTWAITARNPETQCLNLNGAGECNIAYHLSVSGLTVDMIYTSRINGSFALTSEGILVGEVTNPKSKTVYPTTIQMR